MIISAKKGDRGLRLRGLCRLMLAGVLLVIVGGGICTLHAQVTGTISGFVRDPSAAAIPGATVTAKLVDQQTTRTVQTNTEGNYIFLAMQPGKYEVTFEASGFGTHCCCSTEYTCPGLGAGPML